MVSVMCIINTNRQNYMALYDIVIADAEQNNSWLSKQPKPLEPSVQV